MELAISSCFSVFLLSLASKLLAAATYLTQRFQKVSSCDLTTSAFLNRWKQSAILGGNTLYRGNDEP